jgi:hypothetical protein
MVPGFLTTSSETLTMGDHYLVLEELLCKCGTRLKAKTSINVRANMTTTKVGVM